MEVFIVRHGKTDWNEKKLVQGRTDIPLSDKGRTLLLETKEQLKDINFDLCISSPLSRTLETAHILIGDKCPIITDDALIERDGGILEGTTVDMDKLGLTWDFNRYTEIEGAEGPQETLDRTKLFLDKLKKMNVNKVLLVSHGGTIKGLHYNIVGWDINTDFNKQLLTNGEISHYEI